ncbi:hypothetical protein VTN77DRAFT_2458 [Rasamsonia byssochlamydoides]|uniref:uncharacterized protein n=1 Tax=Rasamsonia byssochlamydoides TaxID=89139 RepID=UPI00374343D3
MPRPPARRNRLAPQGQASSTRSAKSNSKDALPNSHNSEKSDDSHGIVKAIPGPPNPPVPASREVDAQNGHESTPKTNRTPTANPYEYAIESSPPERTGTGSRPPTRARGYSSTLSLAGRKGDTSSRVGGTPAFESSILSNFRRRPRQPSILQMMQADDGSSDLDDDDFLGGLSPEDESTPLNISRPKSLVPNSLIVSPSAPPLSSPPSSKDSRKRKRKSMEMHEAELSPRAADVLQRRSSYSSVQADVSEPQSPSATASVQSPNLTMAAPLSSSPGVPHERLSPELLRKRVDQGSTALQEDEKFKVLPKLPTATLQERFLPRRRLHSQRWRDDHDGERDGSEEDVEQSEDDSSDEDELNSSTSRRARRARRRGLFEGRSINAKVKSKRVDHSARKEGGGGTKNGTNMTKSTVTAVSVAKPNCSQPRSRFTYSRRDADIADKENYLSDDSSSLSSPPPSDELDSDAYSPVWKHGNRIFSRELEEQARKFAEIDKWQMDFEEVSDSGSPSSSFR